MTRFTNGPAAGVALSLRRAPLFLRVVQDGAGGWDALDELQDKPDAGERLTAYRKVKSEGHIHLYFGSGKRGRASGWYAIATYEVVEPQPDDATMRETGRWREWAWAQVGRSPATKGA